MKRDDQAAARHRPLGFRDLAGVDGVHPEPTPRDALGGARKRRRHHDPIVERVGGERDVAHRRHQLVRVDVVGYARRSRCRRRAPATSPRRSLRTPTRRRASSRCASSSSRGATSASPLLSPKARAAPRPRAAASAARTRPTSAGVETGAAESSSIVVPKIASTSSRGASHRYASACTVDTPRGHPAASTGAPSLLLGARSSGTSVPLLRGRPSAR